MTNDTAKPASEGQPPRAVRADAQRNEDAVLEAAKTVFFTSGVDAPVREIAAEKRRCRRDRGSVARGWGEEDL